MKILAINGSHRGRRGATQHLLDLLAEGARAGGASFDTVVLAGSRLQRCLGCFACQPPKGHLQCVYQDRDEVAAMHASMREADLLVYATPVYVFGMSSLLKSFLERFMSTADCGDFRVTRSGLLFHHVEPALCSKPFLPLVCCDNLESATPRNVVDYFQTFARFMDAPLVGTLVRPTAQGLLMARTPEGAARYPQAPGVFQAFRDAGRELATRGRISRITQWRAGRTLLDIPVPIQWLMRLGLRAVKQVAAQRARGLVPAAPGPA